MQGPVEHVLKDHGTPVYIKKWPIKTGGLVTGSVIEYRFFWKCVVSHFLVAVISQPVFIVACNILVVQQGVLILGWYFYSGLIRQVSTLHVHHTGTVVPAI